jgi:hypothetical protein
MHETAKIEEAEHVLKLMRQTELDSGAFRHDLSAFLNSARSVLQFAHKEAKPKPGGQAWYDSQMASSLVCQFFKEERDRNIHEKPTHPKAVVTTKLGSNVKFTNAGKFEVHREGQVIQGGDIKDPPQDKLQPENVPSVNAHFLFDDWKGPEDVITLCELCVQQPLVLIP